MALGVWRLNMLFIAEPRFRYHKVASALCIMKRHQAKYRLAPVAFFFKGVKVSGVVKGLQ